MKSETLTNFFLPIILICIICLIFISNNKNMATGINRENIDRTMNVTGKAESFVKPDEAKISFGVTAKNNSTAMATQSINERISALIKKLKDNSVEEKDIKTIDYNIYPEYKYPLDGDRRIFDGYRVSQKIEVTVRDLDKISSILSIVDSANLDEVSQLTFSVSNKNELKKNLRSQAISDARANAEKIAKDLDVKIVNVISFSETNDTSPENMEVDYAVEERKDSVSAIIPKGENRLTSSVFITYEIK